MGQWLFQYVKPHSINNGEPFDSYTKRKSKRSKTFKIRGPTNHILPRLYFSHQQQLLKTRKKKY